MALSKFEKDMAVIQKLDDEPNDVGGLTAAELKAKFDEGGEAVKKYLNDTLTPELEHGFSEKVPSSTTINGHPLTENVTITKDDVELGNVDNTSDLDKPISTAQQKALDALDRKKANAEDVLTKDNHTPYTPTEPDHPATKGYVDETTAGVVMGQLPDSSVTTAKLAGKSVTTDKIADRAVTPEKLDRAYLPLSGGTLTGPVTLHGDPQGPLQAAPKQYVDSVRAITRRLPVAEGYSVKAGDVVDVGKAPVSEKAAVGSRTEGSIVYLNEGGKPVEFYVAKHDYESGLNGAGRTLVVRKDIYDKRQWHNSISSSYATSDIDGWLNDTYKGVLDPEVQNAMGTTKFSYTPGSGNWAVGVLERSVFLLSYTELGFSSAAINVEGSLLPIAGTLQVASYNGNPDEWWSRSPNKQTDGNIWYINKSGKSANNGSIVKYGSRPVFTLPADFEVLVPSDAIVKNIEPQANVENVIQSNAVSVTAACDLNVDYALIAEGKSNGVNHHVYLISKETGKKVREAVYINNDNLAVSSLSMSRLDDSRFVVGYVSETGTQTKIGTIDGTSILFSGSSGNFANPTGDTSVELGDNLAARIHCNSSGLTIRTVSASSNNDPVWGAQGTLSAITSASGLSATQLPDDESGNKRVCVCFADVADGSKGKAVIATIDSTNQVTWGEVVTFESSAVPDIDICTNGTDAVVFFKTNYSSSSVANQHVRLLQVSNNLISLPGEKTPVWNRGSGAQDRPVSISRVGEKCVCLVTGGNSIDGSVAVVVSRSGNELTPGEPFKFNTSSAMGLSSNANSNKMLMVAYAAAGNSNYGTCTILTVDGDQIAGSFLDKSSQAIALQDGNAGDLIDIIYSGTAELPGTAQGTKIESPGVHGYAPVDGLLEVFPWYLPGVKIATGSYTGNGVYGSGNPNTLTFPFEPKMLMVLPDPTIASTSYCGFWCLGNPGITGQIPANASGSTVSVSGNTISWFSTGNAQMQLNVDNQKYYYIALG